jgi:hypothetical protein
VRAERVAQFHYTQGYRFYSSMEHTDAMALNSYITEWNEIGPKIGSGPSDDYIGIALVHSFHVMADLLVAVLQYFGIDRPDVLHKLEQASSELCQDDRGSR